MSNPGGTRGNHFMAAARRAGIKARQTRAEERAANVAPIVKTLQAAGVTSLKGIAKALNDSGVLTPAGRAYWHAMQVARVL
jgi:predicted flap endonuclease-1-like 5' DNA nuclease